MTINGGQPHRVGYTDQDFRVVVDEARPGEAIRADFDKTHACTTYRVGKKAAGAELDGRMHREFPHG